MSPASISTEYIDGSPRIAFDAVGRGDPVICLHGIGGNRTNWHDQLPAFAAAGYRAMSWDARGYGLSDDYVGALDFSEFSSDLLRMLDTLDIARAHLVGLSMGGRILQDFYPENAERVASLVLCDTFPGYDASFTPEKREEFVRLRKKPLVEDGKEPIDIAPAVARTLVGPNASDTHYQRLIDSIAALHKDSYIKTIDATTNYDRVANLPLIKAPTLLVFGAEDRLTPPKIGEQMASAIESSELVVIDDAGHLVNIEQPQRFNNVVLDFLARHPIS